MELRGCPSTWPHHYGEHWSHLTRPAGAALNVWQVFGENPPQCSINIKWNESEGPVVISEHQIQECGVADCGRLFFMLKEGNKCIRACYNQLRCIGVSGRELHVPDSYLQQHFLLNIIPYWLYWLRCLQQRKKDLPQIVTHVETPVQVKVIYLEIFYDSILFSQCFPCCIWLTIIYKDVTAQIALRLLLKKIMVSTMQSVLIRGTDRLLMILPNLRVIWDFWIFCCLFCFSSMRAGPELCLFQQEQT